eukprot:gnl/Dysnectes_brevis/1388_a1563_1906.p1 GENE.gnl/Dysnectes_brevis/1388_a1563_1906~~gnl/Dysnectes_brevis/1388_a1563_1906.p1  ORF type:complete len:458 (-),score=140.63 gnl/Dysnectes_brevis/1388_a1563_1906:75-1448(-)
MSKYQSLGDDPIDPSEPQIEAKESKNLRLAFMLLGIGALLPFNCIITPIDFWDTFYPSNFLFIAPLLYNTFNWGCMIFMIFKSQILSANFKVMVPLTTWLICISIIPFFQLMFPDDSQMTLKNTLTLIAVSLCGLVNGSFFPTLISIGSELGPQYPQAFMAGNGLAGILPTVLRIGTKWFCQVVYGDQGESDSVVFVSTLLYFLLAGAFVLICFWAWRSLKAHLRAEGTLMGEQEDIDAETGADVVPTSEQTDPAPTLGDDQEEEEEELDSGVPLTAWELSKLMKVPMFTVCFVFAVTLTLFPAITDLIPCQPGTDCDPNGWWGIWMMSAFMLFDYVGRSLPGWFSRLAVLMDLKALFWVSLARLLFLPLFLLMACPLNGPTSEIYIRSDFLALFTMSFFALTNGYTSTMVMMHYPKLIKHDRDMHLAGTVATFFLNTGLLIGGIFSPIVGSFMGAT